MLLRFSLYGFLKNQQYYEPFIILAFLEKGLSFTTIGALVGFREIAKAIMEIPSGAVADLFGRRHAMVFSFVAYIASFVMFALFQTPSLLLIAMFCFAIGEAFRTGTHKAMIFHWLRHHGRLEERTRIYGYTRSWSKIGSAVSAIAAAIFVLVSGSYTSVFWLCVIPYIINIVNILGYPNYVDVHRDKRPSILDAISLSLSTTRMALTRKGLRGLFAESMMLEGAYLVNKDYLQPVLEKLVLTMPLFLLLFSCPFTVTQTQKSAVVLGIVFAINFLLMSVASRRSHKVVQRLGGEERMTGVLWIFNGLCYLGITVLLAVGWAPGAVLCFLLSGIIQNLFRPAQISRFDKHSPADAGATILSIESQAKALTAAIIAPVVGLVVDRLIQGGASGASAFWPAAAVGCIGSIAVLLGRWKNLRSR